MKLSDRMKRFLWIWFKDTAVFLGVVLALVVVAFAIAVSFHYLGILITSIFCILSFMVFLTGLFAWIEETGGM